jgi:hypothetical protein
VASATATNDGHSNTNTDYKAGLQADNKTIAVLGTPPVDLPQSAVKVAIASKSKTEAANRTMNHEAFHIYTAKIAIPKGDIDKKSRYQTEIQKKYPGMKVEFVENYSAHVIELLINAGAPTQDQLSNVEALAAQLHDLVIKIGHSN